MKNLILVLSLLFFAPTPNFAVTASIHQKTEVVKLRKANKTESQNQKLGYIFLGIALGGLIGGLLTSSVPIVALIAYLVGFIFSILALVFIIKAMKEKK